MKITVKLYKVTLKGMTYSTTGRIYGISYVIAYSMDEAYQKVRNYLDREDIGYEKERILDKIELIAEDNEDTNVQHMLFCACRIIV